MRVPLSMLLLLPSALVPCFATTAAAQEIVWEHPGVQDLTHVLEKLAVIGDVDGDGYNDLVVEFEVAALPYPKFQLRTLSGRDGQVLRVRDVPLGYKNWCLASAGDWDRDGVDDYVVMLADQPGYYPLIVEVRSGRDERLLWRTTNYWQSAMGLSLLGDLDLDGDGKPDLVMSAPGEHPFGVIYAFANSGQLLYRLQANQQLRFGNRGGTQTLGKVGDVDDDGCDDFVSGGGDTTAFSGRGAGGGILFSGRTGKVLAVGLDEQQGDNLGATVDGCGDLDGDGVPDFVAGSWGTAKGGAVRAFSSKTGQAIHSWRGPPNSTFAAWALKSGGVDVDQDGVPDVIATTAGNVRVLSGRDGTLIQHYMQYQGYLLGQNVAVIGRQPGSRFPLYATVEQAYGANTRPPLFYLGRVIVFRGSPPGVEAFGLSCQGTLNASPTIGARDMGVGGIRVSVHGAAPNAPALLLVGGSRQGWAGLPLPWPLAPVGLPGCSLYTSAEVVVPTTTGSAGVAAGYAWFDLPTVLSATGRYPLHAQWLFFDPAAPRFAGVSDALAWRAK